MAKNDENKIEAKENAKKIAISFDSSYIRFRAAISEGLYYYSTSLYFISSYLILDYIQSNNERFTRN